MIPIPANFLRSFVWSFVKGPAPGIRNFVCLIISGFGWGAHSRTDFIGHFGQINAGIRASITGTARIPIHKASMPGHLLLRSPQHVRYVRVSLLKRCHFRSVVVLSSLFLFESKAALHRKPGTGRCERFQLAHNLPTEHFHGATMPTQKR